MYAFFIVFLVLAFALFVAGNHMESARGRTFFHTTSSLVATIAMTMCGLVLVSCSEDGASAFIGRFSVIFTGLIIVYLPVIMAKKE